jgi:AraC-like DNA-binding protein/CheY-like chemotaxis protein
MPENPEQWRRDDARFKFVTAAHHFLATVMPFRDGESRTALGSFLDSATRTTLPTPELDAVLLRTLAILDRHAGGRLPSMVEQYVATAFRRSTVLARFRECVENVLRYRGIGDRLVQRGIAIIERQYSDSTLSAKAVADALSTRPERLAAAFHAQTGMNGREYLRNLRLDRAAALLLTSNNSVKEVWAAVGYNHASNFDHDFHSRFGISPRQYRARGTHPETVVNAVDRALRPVGAGRAAGSPQTVLVIDDDSGSRVTIGRYLELEGFGVIPAENGEEGLLQATRTRPHAVLLDYRLPDIDGLEWLHLFRRGQPTTPVVMFTADWDLEQKLDELTALGATFLSKLCDLEDVRDTLRACTLKVVVRSTATGGRPTNG